MASYTFDQIHLYFVHNYLNTYSYIMHAVVHFRQRVQIQNNLIVKHVKRRNLQISHKT